MFIFVGFVIVLFAVLLDNMMTRHHNHDAHVEKKKSHNFGLRVRKNIWFVTLALHTSMLLGLPLQAAFGVTRDIAFDGQVSFATV